MNSNELIGNLIFVSQKLIIVQNKNLIIYITINSFKSKEYLSFEYNPIMLTIILQKNIYIYTYLNADIRIGKFLTSTYSKNLLDIFVLLFHVNLLAHHLHSSTRGESTIILKKKKKRKKNSKIIPAITWRLLNQ